MRPVDCPPFILASGSPQRRRLLHEAGYRFEVEPSRIEEPATDGFATPTAYAAHAAWLKATDVASPRAGRWVLGADTVACVGSTILGKPVDRSDADGILRLLAGTRHQVITGVCLRLPKPEVSLVAEVTTEVVMKPLTDFERTGYLDTGLWEGKAGAYGIQDHDDPFVTALEGSVSNVIGLPMERLSELFAMARKLDAG